MVTNNEVPFKTFVGIPTCPPPDVSPQPVVKHTDLSAFLEGGFDGKHAGCTSPYISLKGVSNSMMMKSVSNRSDLIIAVAAQ